MSSCVIAVEPAVSEETEEVTHLTKVTHLIFRYIGLSKEYAQQEIIGETAPYLH